MSYRVMITIINAFLLLLSLARAAETADPGSWNFVATKLGDQQFEIRLTPTIKSPWHIYSQSSPEGGGSPTKIVFRKNPLITLDGKTQEIGKVVSRYEEVFDVTVKYFPGKVVFVQKVKLKKNVKTVISGTVEYMACTDEECLPPQTVTFSMPLE